MSDLLERLKSAIADRYAIESEIGRGGMAVVFLAEDLRHERRVAIKVLHPELTTTLGGERFLREIKTVAGLHRPDRRRHPGGGPGVVTDYLSSSREAET